LIFEKLELLYSDLLLFVNLLNSTELMLKDIKFKKEKSMAARFKPAQPQETRSCETHAECPDEAAIQIGDQPSL
jgi:hypothetical protein